MKLLNIYKKNFNSKVFFFILFFDDIRIMWDEIFLNLNDGWKGI